MTDLPDCKVGQYLIKTEDGFDCKDAPTPVQQEFASLLQFLRTEAEAGVAAAKTQVPVVVHDIVAYQRVKMGTCFGVGLTLLLISLFLFQSWRRAYAGEVKVRGRFDDGRLPAAVVLGGFGLMGSIGFGVAFARALWMPSLVVLDYVRGLL